MTTKEVYVAYDGTEFYDKDRCKEHEMKLDKQQYKTLIKAIKGMESFEISEKDRELLLKLLKKELGLDEVLEIKK